MERSQGVQREAFRESFERMWRWISNHPGVQDAPQRADMIARGEGLNCGVPPEERVRKGRPPFGPSKVLSDATTPRRVFP